MRIWIITIIIIFLMDFQIDDTHYDVVILGTGLTESICSASLQKNEKKVLNLDADTYYGASIKTFNLREWIQYFNHPPNKINAYRLIAQTPFELKEDKECTLFGASFNFCNRFRGVTTHKVENSKCKNNHFHFTGEVTVHVKCK